MSALSQIPIFIDDSGTLTVTEVRSRCRRLQSGDGLAAVFIDYLQLLRPSVTSRNSNRNDELSEICRILKATAKDLQIPIIALAQLNRGVESRNDKRPMLSDLRDCLAGDACVTDADTGLRVPVREIVERNLRFNVWAVDERLHLVRRPIVDSWKVGTRQVFRLTTQSGRTVRATAGHRFLTVAGWKKLGELERDETIAVPREMKAPLTREPEISTDRALLLGWLLGDGHLGGSPTLTVGTLHEAELAKRLAEREFGVAPVIKPERGGANAWRVILTMGEMCGAGKNPLTAWLRALGSWKKTGARKDVPACLYGQSDEVVAAFLRGLFHADGSLSRGRDVSRVTVRLSTISESLARSVQHLLLRLGINAIARADRRNIGGYRTKTSSLWTLSIGERSAVARFMDRIGFLDEKHRCAVAKLTGRKENDASQFDRIPIEVNRWVNVRRAEERLTHASLGWREQGKAMSRSTCAMLAERLDDEHLARLAFSDVLWDRVVSIEPQGEEDVFDITVDELHNFCVDDIVTHNSGAIEQEADMVSFLYRDAYYNPESAPEPDLTEFIIAKQRNGPTGTIKLRFIKENTLFVPYGDSSHYSRP